MQTKQQIEAILTEKFSPETLEVIDESALHAGHAGARESGGGHFVITIISDSFSAKKRIERHRMVYDSLRSLLENNAIHAVSIKALTKDELAT